MDYKSRKMGIVRELWGKLRRNFSALQTVWRRGRDSNPRYPFGYAGFQDRCHQPLGHLSGSASVLSQGAAKENRADCYEMGKGMRPLVVNPAGWMLVGGP